MRLALSCRYRVAEDFLPVHLLSMVNLRTLKLERCGGLTVPLTLYELRCLEELSIRYCEVVTFVDKGYMATTFTVAKLKSLTLSSTNLHSLPYQVTQILRQKSNPAKDCIVAETLQACAHSLGVA